nr:class B sortase [uncultured Blautia sp.]
MSSSNNEKKRTAGDYILIVVLVVAVGVFCFAAFNLFHIFTEYKKGTDEYKDITQMAVTERDPDEEAEDLEQPQQQQPVAPISVDFSSLKEINDDVIGWIYMEALPEISYPVVQGKDNSTYLHTTYEKNYNFAGTIFIDYENKRDFNDCNTLVYGHNMKNGSMFGKLKKYSEDDTLYKTSKYFWILTPDQDYRYEIIAAYTTAVDSDTYTLFKGPGRVFLEYEKKMIANSEIQTDVKAEDANMKDKIVTLSTCTGNQATRFVVQGKLVNAVDPRG